jgi:hypothetical protein
LTESIGTLGYQRESRAFRVFALICAVAISAIVFGGYAYLRKRHARQTLINTQPPSSAAVARQAPKAHIAVDEVLLKGGQSIIGGTVKNISNEKLHSLTVELELRRRKDGGLEGASVPLDPPQLEPEAEGQYSLRVLAQDYGSVRLVGLKSAQDGSLLPYTISQGQKRPLERLQPKTIILSKPNTRRDEFLNSPDKPARVP